MFDSKSRYAKLVPILVKDARGRTVQAVPPAPVSQEGLLGTHLRRQGERPDHLAARYLADAAGYWRLGHINDAMTAEVLSDLREVLVPDGSEKK